MGVSYNDFISAVTNYYNAEAGIPSTSWGAGATWTEVSKSLGNVGINTDNYINYLENYPELFEITRNVDGTVLDASLKKYMYYGNVNEYNTGTGGSLNSNKIPSTFTDSTGLNISGITTKSTTGKLTAKGGIGLKTDTGLTVQGVISTIGTGVVAVGVGATLGKVIGDGLYNANPDFWSTGKVSKLSETDWNKFAITVKDDVGTLVNKGALALWGVDGDTTTMYVDENALAYITWYLASLKFFDENVNADYQPYDSYKYTGNFVNGVLWHGVPLNSNIEVTGNVEIISSSDVVYISAYKPFYSTPTSVSYEILLFSKQPFTYKLKHWNYDNGEDSDIINSSRDTTLYDKTYYQSTRTLYTNNWKSCELLTNYIDDDLTWSRSTLYTPKISSQARFGLIPYAFFTLFSATITTVSNYDGVSNNPESTQFNPTGVNSMDTASDALKKQYPNLWNDSIKRNTIQDDGSEDERIFIPIPIPKYLNPFDEHPTTGTPSQADPSVKPETTPKDELDNIPNTTTKNPTQSDVPNTGGGSSPDIIVPTQQASSLWAIYNPTLSQLNSLGAWLWSSNFIDQLLKIFNDPMQAIIGLHKVYASPNISGSGNIKVGYLDSGVPSNIVGNQYTYIDCGTVSLREYYGNILDYSPYTTVQLYLPFIGIVSLDIADVSRSSINVKYGVDVLTGACLASVSVQRDNAGGILYQYSGNCACQYPLSSGSYMGMITGTLGAIGSLARGNIIGTGLSVSGMHTNIEHSGGFSGNAGAMGIKKPYLIISRPQSVINDGFPSIQGYPSNYFTRLGNCSGFTQIAECHVDNIPATDKELDKIKDLLKEGVII